LATLDPDAGLDNLEPPRELADLAAHLLTVGTRTRQVEGTAAGTIAAQGHPRQVHRGDLRETALERISTSTTAYQENAQ
jgi:hypothetical protein